MLQRRVRNNTAIPEIIGADLHHGKARRQRARRHHMLWQDGVGLVVEKDEIARHHIHRPYRKAHRLAVEQVKINHFGQGLAQRRCIVIAGRILGACRQHPGIELVRLKETRLTLEQGGHSAEGVAPLFENIAFGRRQPQGAVGDAAPKFAQGFQPLLQRIAGDDRRIDAADGDAGNPVRIQPRFVQGLIDPRLIGAQRAAALQHQGDAVTAVGTAKLAACGRTGMQRFCVHDPTLPDSS